MGAPLTTKLYLPLILMSLIGFGVMFHPYTLNQNVGANAYLTIVWALIITGLMLAAIHSLRAQYPGESGIDWGYRFLGKAGWLGSALLLITILLFIVMAIRRATEPVGTLILFLTPEWANNLSFILVISYMAALGEEALGRLASVFCGLLLIMGFNLILGLGSVNRDYIHPAFIFQDFRYLKYWWSGLPSFAPLLLIGSLIPLRRPQPGLRPLLATVFIGAAILGIIALEIAGVFGAAGVQRYPRPIMAYMGTIRLAQEFFFQNLVITTHLFIFVTLTSLITAILLRMLANGLIQLFKIEGRFQKLVIPLIAAVVYLISLASDLMLFSRFNNLFLMLGTMFIVIYLLILWICSRFRREPKP